VTLLKQRKSGDDAPSKGGDSPALDTAGERVIDWDYLDPDVADVLKSIQSKHEAEVKELRAKLDEVSGVVREQFQVAAQQRFDGYIESMEKSHQKILESPKSRKQLRDEMDVLAEGYRSKGREVPVEKDLFDRAFNALFSDEVKKIDADRIKRQIKRRQSQFTAPPSAREALPEDHGDPGAVAKASFLERYNSALASKE